MALIFQASHVVSEVGSESEGRGDTPWNGLYGEAPPERGIFLRLQVNKRVGKRAYNGQQIYFMSVKKSRKRSGFVIYSYFKHRS